MLNLGTSSISFPIFYHKNTARFFCVPGKKWPGFRPLRAKNNPFWSQKFALAQTKVSFHTLKGNLSHPKKHLLSGLFLGETSHCLHNSFVFITLRKCGNLAFYAPTEKFFQNFPATRASNKGVCQYFSYRPASPRNKASEVLTEGVPASFYFAELAL